LPLSSLPCGPTRCRTQFIVLWTFRVGLLRGSGCTGLRFAAPGVSSAAHRRALALPDTTRARLLVHSQRHYALPAALHRSRTAALQQRLLPSAAYLCRCGERFSLHTPDASLNHIFSARQHLHFALFCRLLHCQQHLPVRYLRAHCSSALASIQHPTRRDISSFCTAPPRGLLCTFLGSLPAASFMPSLLSEVV